MFYVKQCHIPETSPRFLGWNTGCSGFSEPGCHNSLLMVGCVSDRSLNPSKWGMTYGDKEDLILNVMVGFHGLNDL